MRQIMKIKIRGLPASLSNNSSSLGDLIERSLVLFKLQMRIIESAMPADINDESSQISTLVTLENGTISQVMLRRQDC